MGRSFASLFSRQPSVHGFIGPTERPLDSAARESKQSRPLINLNPPASPVQAQAYPNAPRTRARGGPMSPSTKGRALNGRRAQLALRVLELLGGVGSLFCSIIITELPASIVWIIRVGPIIAILHTLFGIFHLSRSPIGKPPGTQANYMVFASTFDLGLIPFYIFAAYIAYIEYANHAYNWGTLLGNHAGIPHIIANITFILSIVNGGMHAVSFGLSMFLGTIFRQITRLPPDMNPLEDNLTARPHKRTKSELTEKHNSNSTLDSGIGMDDPLIGAARPTSFPTHNHYEPLGESYFYGNSQPRGPFVSQHPDQLPYAETPARLPDMPFQQDASQKRNSIPRKPVQSSLPVPNMDNLHSMQTTPTHLEVPSRYPSSVKTIDRMTQSVSPMSDNWIAYPSRSPSPLENLVKENSVKRSGASRDASSSYSRSNTTASTNSAVKDWMASAQRYGWDVGETITEDVRGEYESLAMHEFYAHDDDLQDYPQHNGLYDSTEQDLGDHPIDIYTDNAQSDHDDLDDIDYYTEFPASPPLHPLGLNPPTPQPAPAHSELHNTEYSPNSVDDRPVLADIPNLSPIMLPGTPPAGDSPLKKTGRYGDLERNPSISVDDHRHTNGQRKPSSQRKSSGKKTKATKQDKTKSYGALRQDDHGSDEENFDENTPALANNENDRKGRVVSNSGADVMAARHTNTAAAGAGNNAGAGAGLSSYGNYIAGLGVGMGRRRDVSGKMAEEGRGGGMMVNSGRPGTEPEHKTPIRAAGWARFAGL